MWKLPVSWLAPIGALVGLCATTGCSDAVGSTDGYATEKGPFELDVALTWNVGEGEEDEPLADGVTYDEDEWSYVGTFRVALGPASECIKPYDERSADAVCTWQVPSSWWHADLTVRSHDGVPTLNVDVFAGDADTQGGSSLPVESVPATAPWTFDFSPDNASGAWGHFSSAIIRVEASAPAGDCCVVCSTGHACGDSCISADATCSQQPGCACNAE